MKVAANHGEAAPPEVGWAAFTEELSAELLQDAIDLHEYVKASLHGSPVVRQCANVILEPDRIRYFHRHRPQMHLDIE